MCVWGGGLLLAYVSCGVGFLFPGGEEEAQNNKQKSTDGHVNHAVVRREGHGRERRRFLPAVLRPGPEEEGHGLPHQRALGPEPACVVCLFGYTKMG